MIRKTVTTRLVYKKSKVNTKHSKVHYMKSVFLEKVGKLVNFIQNFKALQKDSKKLKDHKKSLVFIVLFINAFK